MKGNLNVLLPGIGSFEMKHTRLTYLPANLRYEYKFGEIRLKAAKEIAHKSFSVGKTTKENADSCFLVSTQHSCHPTELPTSKKMKKKKDIVL